MFLCVCGDKQQLIWLPSPTQRCSSVSSVQWHLHDSQRSAHYTFAYAGIHIHSHTQTHFLSFHYLLCSTHNNTTQANHRACIAWGNKLELKLKYFFQVTFFYPLNSPCEEKKNIKIGITPNTTCQHLSEAIMHSSVLFCRKWCLLFLMMQ